MKDGVIAKVSYYCRRTTRCKRRIRKAAVD